jgi:hypothetical protein
VTQVIQAAEETVTVSDLATENASDLAVEDAPNVAASAREAARGQVVYITEHGQRLAAIVPASVAAWLLKMPSDAFAALAAQSSELGEQFAEFAEEAGDWAEVTRAAAFETWPDA